MEQPAAARGQSGVVDRGQALASGLTDKQIRWRLERGRWRALHRGVYLTNPGAVTWPARAWAALLWAGPGSVLVLGSAAFVSRWERTEPAVISVGVPIGRRVRPTAGVAMFRRQRLTTQRVGGLPVTRAAQTVIDLADLTTTSLDDAVGLAARACQSGRVTASGLLAELDTRTRHRHGGLLRLALGEIGDGAESLPEVWFVTRVQRPHGLPTFVRQVVEVGGTCTDLKNVEFGVTVEIDGQVWHAGERFHTDRRRDRGSAARGDVTVRLTYLDLARDACSIADDIARVLGERGWAGSSRPCPACAAADTDTAETCRP